MTDRETARVDFLEQSGWGDAERRPLAGDASTRRYERLVRGSETAVLMDAPPASEQPSCPPGASESERRALGYNALACLAGPDPAPFVAVANWLNGLGLSAPKVIAADLTAGLILLEDLGDALYSRVLRDGATAEPLYRAAVDVLVALHTAGAPSSLDGAAGRRILPHRYDNIAMQAEADLLPEWYLPFAGIANTEGDLQSYRAAWSPVLDLPRDPAPVFVLRDFHADNLIWLPERAGVARVGLLDFQDGLIGPAPYDLVSLLEDARRDVPEALASAMLDYYCAEMHERDAAFDATVFRRAYAILGAQRNAKIIGIFARLALRDGKTAYLQHLPRVWRYFEGDLQDAALAPVRAWIDAHIPVSRRGLTAPHQDAS